MRHGIVLGTGGRLDVESEPRRGNVFRVILPATPAAQQRTALHGAGDW